MKNKKNTYNPGFGSGRLVIFGDGGGSNLRVNIGDAKLFWRDNVTGNRPLYGYTKTLQRKHLTFGLFFGICEMKIRWINEIFQWLKWKFS